MHGVLSARPSREILLRALESLHGELSHLVGTHNFPVMIDTSELLRAILSTAG